MSILIFGAILLFSCSSNDESPTGPKDDPPVSLDTIAVSPTSGAPGSQIEISGYAVDPLDTNIMVYVGDHPTVFISDSSGLNALIPLFYDSVTNWSNPPVGLQNVTIRVDSQIVAIAPSALLIDSLPHADGATSSILQNLQVVSGSLRSIMNSLNSSPESDPRLPGYRIAILSMLDSILVGADSSITALVNGNSSWNNNQPVDLALIDALLASSGALEFYDEMAGSLGQLNKALIASQSQGLICKSGGPDMDLACEMQVYVILDAYATYFVKPTTTTYANTIGLVGGVLAISGVGLAGESVIGALLTVFDFVYTVLAPSLFPAEITQFSLFVESDTIAVDELTNTYIQVSAKNKPATIKTSDVLGQLLTMYGLSKASEAAEQFIDFLVNAMKWALDLYRKAIVQYNSDMGGSVFIDPQADLPPMTWGPVTITHSDLVELFSFTEDVIIGDTASVEWKGVSRGEGRIQARARGAGERSKVLIDNALCWGCVYSGGAFGENAPGTETKTITVGKPARLLVEIKGLPNGTDGNVIVSGPEYSSGRLAATETLTDLAPGDYTITAIEVLDSHGDAYLPNPMDTTVTLDDDDYKTVTIEYKPEFGNMLLTVVGLPEGVDADITVMGTSGPTYYVTGDTLIDSLLPGDYDVAASEVTGTGGTVYTPNQSLQTIQVNGAETATASVVYGGASLTIQMGANSPDNLPDNIYGLVSVRSDHIGPSWSNPVPEYPAFSWINGCYPDQGLLIENSYETGGSEGGAQGMASASFLKKSGNKEIEIAFNLSASGTVPPAPTDPFEINVVQVLSNFQTIGPNTLALRVNKPGGRPSSLEFTWDISSSATNSVTAYFSVTSPYPCQGMGYGDYLFSYSIPSGETRNGADTVVLGTDEQYYLALYPQMQVKGGGQSTYDGTLDRTWGGSLTGTVTIRIIE